MYTYNVSIDYVNLLNLMHTDMHEVATFLNIKMLLFFILLFVFPAVLVCKTNIIFSDNVVENIKIKGAHCIFNIFLLILIIAPVYKAADNFYREQKHLRYYLMPTNYVGTMIFFVRKFPFSWHKKIAIGDDVKIEKYWDNDKKNLIVLVVGESARAANFSLGGYKRNTNEPMYRYKEDFVYFSNAYSCGTATIVSVPCIFSHKNKRDFILGTEKYTENLTDMMKKANYFVMWRENNTDCQNVCNRTKIEKKCKKKHCHDEILLSNLDEKLEKNEKDFFLVLHQRGSHGPDYYNMYPPEFEKYTPVCRQNDLSNCSTQKLVNVYDNTIEYTSYFLAELMQILQKAGDKYNVLMIFVSDHGESLGENGVYLHSAIYKYAPDEQKHIPFLIWMPKETQENFAVDMNCLQEMSGQYVSHDNIFHTILGFAGAHTKLYNQEYNILKKCQKTR